MKEKNESNISNDDLIKGNENNNNNHAPHWSPTAYICGNAKKLNCCSCLSLLNSFYLFAFVLSGTFALRRDFIFYMLYIPHYFKNGEYKATLIQLTEINNVRNWVYKQVTIVFM